MTPNNLFRIVLLFYACLSYATCLSTPGTKVGQCVEKERDALLQFKQGILFDKCSLLDTWGGSLDCCHWTGVHCNNHSGHVTRLRLHGHQYIYDDDFIEIETCLQGTLSDSLVALKHLTYLNLSFNDFCGQSIPKSIGLFANLEYLDLSNAQFGGVIPNEIGNLTKLSSLNIGYDDFSSLFIMQAESLSWLSHLKSLRNVCLDGIDLSIASNWVSIINSLPFLEVLSMNSCSLSTEIPSSLSYINASKTLTGIALSNNNFNGTSIFRLLRNFSGIETNLLYLELANNNFSSGIPSIIWKMQSLLYLDLGNTYLSGQIPSEIGNMEKLSFLELGHNDLSGPIPSEIWTIGNLSYLSFTRNNLDGPVLSGISNLELLSYLNLKGNKLQLSRQFLRSLGKLCSLQKLVLDGNNLTCEFSEVVEALSCSHKSLVTLSLSNTRVWGSLPNIISKFSSLETLYIDNNQLNGTIGEMIGQLSRLESLDLSSNNLNGVVSHNHFSSLLRLRGLDLSYNQALRLNISTDWRPPFQLVELMLSSCKVGLTFPNWILTQQRLKSLDISGTGIFDVIPKSFWSSTVNTLTYLNISNNLIQGVLPDLPVTFGADAAIIDMSSNNLSGAVPSFLRNNVSLLSLNNNNFCRGLRFLCLKTGYSIHLYFLDLSNNLFSETLPDCWQYFPELSVLRLQNNNISGNLPPSITSLSMLQALHLRNNSLSGELTHMSWDNLKSLVVIDFAYNSLSGSIPPTFGYGLVNLRFLSLKNNHFSMGIPSSLCQLTSLQILYLSSNNLSGPLPKCLYNLTMMANHSNFPQPIEFFSDPNRVDFATFMWKRKEWSFNVMLGLVKGIDISDNNLQGQIPDEVSSLFGLGSLNLSHNDLSGPIPSKIGRLTSLQFLDLSHNRISGTIPTSLALIDDLAMLDLSSNNLSGKIPIGTQLQGFNASVYMGNPGLCGEPLCNCTGDEETLITPGNGDNITTQKEHTNNTVFSGLLISVVLGFITGFWGVFGTLALKRSWRHAFFRFYDDTKDQVYVMLVVNITRVCRRSST